MGFSSAITTLAFVVHISAGTLALVSGTVAAIARKGWPLHRTAGDVFVVSMLVMAVFAIYLAVVMPGQLVNVFISIFASYLVTTGWMAGRRGGSGMVGLPEMIALLVGIILCAPFTILSFQLATGMPPLFKSATPFKGPLLIAIYSFTAVLLIAALGDAKVLFTRGIEGVPRISRHLWRMCLGLTLAAGSAFTNGVARLLPGHYHVPVVLFLPQFLPVCLLIFWMIRVRFAGWERRPGKMAVVRSH